MLKFLKISEHNYYRVGHAAVALICPRSGEVHYFDFGRYHAPFGHGRVRSKDTDHELQLTNKGLFNHSGDLLNYYEILNELANKEACHGSGMLHAGLLPINFEKAINKAKEMQERSPIPYGPLLPDGTNCSRFVRSVMKAGVLSKTKKIHLHLPLTISPTPVGNIAVSTMQTQIKPLFTKSSYCPSPKSREFLKGTLPEPPKPEHLPATIQWLAGEGAGSWFHLEEHPMGISVRRYDPNGVLECYGIYRTEQNHAVDVSACRVTHPSHCGMVTVHPHSGMHSHEKTITLKRIKHHD